MEMKIVISEEMLKKTYSVAMSNIELTTGGTLLDAVEKQVPMIVTDIRNKEQDCFCPSCKALLQITLPNYCWRCGQKLEWSIQNEID